MVVSKAVDLIEDLRDYTAAHSTAPDALVEELVERTRSEFAGDAKMLVTREQAVLLAMLTRLSGARRAVEVGTFTGLSSLSVARALPPDGRLLCLDVSTEFTAVAREFWARGGVTDRIELRIGPAAESLAALAPEPQFDLAFIDADKEQLSTYWAELVPRVRAGGLLIVDNVLWKGLALDPPPDDRAAQAVAAFNDEVVRDERVDVVMLVLADGLTLARKR